MKAIWFEQQGAASDVLIYGNKEKPVPGFGEVLVHIQSSAVNPSDVKKREGTQPAGFQKGYVIPHSDGAGTIESTGEGVENRSGQRVWVYQAQFNRHCGTCAEYVTVPSALVQPLPDNTDFTTGACIGIPVMTAHRCVFNAGNLTGKTVLITGASGRVGFYAVQWAKLAGARVLATAGNDMNCQLAAGAGADETLNYRDEKLISNIEKFAGKSGIDHIVDVEFGANAVISAAVLKNGGSISTYSSSRVPCPAIPFYPLMFKNITLNMVLVYNMPEKAKRQASEDIYRALSQNQLIHRIAEIWDMKDTAKAHESIEAGGLNGCVVVRTGSS